MSILLIRTAAAKTLDDAACCYAVNANANAGCTTCSPPGLSCNINSLQGLLPSWSQSIKVSRPLFVSALEAVQERSAYSYRDSFDMPACSLS